MIKISSLVTVFVCTIIFSSFCSTPKKEIEEEKLDSKHKDPDYCKSYSCPNSICNNGQGEILKFTPVSDPEQIYHIYLIDQSGSMYSEFGDSNRMQVTKEIIVDYIIKNNLSSDIGKNFGLYTFWSDPLKL